jgi:hypothetical protein
MLEKIFEYLADLIAKWPQARPFVAGIRLIKSKLRHFLNAHPIVSICVFVGVCSIFALGPEKLPEMLRPEHKCYAVETDGQELYETDGDTLRLGADRPCEHRQVTAFEFFNDSTVKLSEKAKPIDLGRVDGFFIDE